MTRACSAGSLPGIPLVDVADDDCFSIELDVNHHSFGDEADDVNVVLDLLVSDSPESQLEGLEITERSLEADTWMSTFIRSGEKSSSLWYYWITIRPGVDSFNICRWGGAVCGADGLLLTSRSTELSLIHI